MSVGRLNLTGKLYQPAILPAAQRVALGSPLPAPLVVDLDPTSFCDLACPECISGRLLNQGRFTTERLRSLAAEIVELGVQAVILIGGGEPLAHRGTRVVLEVLGAAGISVGVVTNGTMIDRNLTALADHATWVRVSVDAATASTYREFRPDRHGNCAFGRVVQICACMRPLDQVHSVSRSW